MEAVEKVEKVVGKEASLWRNKKFLFLWIAQIFSGIGEQLHLLALPWIMYDLTRNSTMMGTLAAIEQIPILLLGFLMGALIDNINKKLIMITSLALSIITVISLYSLVNVGYLVVPSLFIAGFVLAFASSLYSVTISSTIPLIIKKDRLVEANSQISLGQNIIVLLGPSLAGILIATFGAQNILWINSFSYFFLILAVLNLKINEDNTKKTTISVRGILKDALEGIKYLWKNNTLRMISFLTLFINIGLGSTLAIFLFYTRELGISSAQMGFIYSGGTIGAISIALTVRIWSKKIGRGKGILIGSITAGIGTILISVSDSLLPLILSYGLLLISVSFANINIVTLIQEITPKDLLGRVNAGNRTISRIAVPFSMLSSGILVNYIKINHIFLASGILIVAIALITFRKEMTFKNIKTN
ncbi:MFS transporter [Sporosarcina sp. PTS2304]|uniref:MFS transporter n=1 Tax=Sporosarcina sp. PTS2304 TaxID=2283194 RepID=UPI000E0D5C69|nr:MFS transporter [Sporosarcina sp. PTS2304]AXH99754.1 MFS transporter [Sporosarcina sp. PTS2304]